MTCLEKYLQDHPGVNPDKIISDECPHWMGNVDSITIPDLCDAGYDYDCRECWNREIPGTEPTPSILDSGSRTEFSTGAVRDVQALEKGRCDLMPLDVVAYVLGNLTDPDYVLMGIATFMGTGQTEHLYYALENFRNLWGVPSETMLLEVAIHMAEGCQKYGERNWEKGIPMSRFVDSGVRHYLKWLRGDKDEPHDRAFCWNIMCGIWTCHHKPELNDYAPKHEKQIPGQLDLFEDDLK